MFFTNPYTAIVSSTDLKRKYKDIKKLLDHKVVVIISNRKNRDEVDGILVPYSQSTVGKIEDMLEDIEIEDNKEKLIEEFKHSYASKEGKRVKLDLL